MGGRPSGIINANRKAVLRVTGRGDSRTVAREYREV